MVWDLVVNTVIMEYGGRWMPFKYSVACPTLVWTGYDLLDTPAQVLKAIIDIGYDGADLPVEKIRSDSLRPIVDGLKLETPEMMG